MSRFLTTLVLVLCAMPALSIGANLISQPSNLMVELGLGIVIGTGVFLFYMLRKVFDL